MKHKSKNHKDISKWPTRYCMLSILHIIGFFETNKKLVRCQNDADARISLY